jgi:hypothetical protein
MFIDNIITKCEDSSAGLVSFSLEFLRRSVFLFCEDYPIVIFEILGVLPALAVSFSKPTAKT